MWKMPDVQLTTPENIDVSQVLINSVTDYDELNPEILSRMFVMSFSLCCISLNALM